LLIGELARTKKNRAGKANGAQGRIALSDTFAVEISADFLAVCEIVYQFCYAAKCP
jgi:hypothetical protein